jgi:tetratricopeptide (TPR) repeat protein
MRCTALWNKGEFAAAIEWGKRGQELKSNSDVDTVRDVSHSLALAERDAGYPDKALDVFLDGRPLHEVLDPDELEEIRGGAYYGNIGRCLQMTGQTDAALICYQKSAILIEKDLRNEHIRNQGFIRKWIGDVLIAKEQYKLSLVFLRSAYLKWASVSPPRAGEVSALIGQLIMRVGPVEEIRESDIEKICLDWILGRRLDSRVA